MGNPTTPETGVEPVSPAGAALDASVEMKAIQDSPWFQAFSTRFAQAAGSIAERPTITGIVLQLNGLRYSLPTALPGIARAFADFLGKVGSADCMRGCAGRLATMGELPESSSEGWIQALVRSMAKLAENLQDFRAARGDAEKQGQLTVRVMAECCNGMAICAAWFRQEYLAIAVGKENPFEVKS